MEGNISVGFTQDVTPEASAWALRASLVCAVWGLGVYALGRDLWLSQPPLAFGWILPILSILLFWRRWPTRPEAWPGSPAVFATGLALVLGVQTFFRWLGAVDPGWELPSALLLPVFALGWALMLYRAGGLGWVWHFFPPFLVLLLALPWTRAVEQSTLPTFSLGLAEAAAEWWNFQGIAAVPYGREVERAGGLLSMTELFRGVISLPALMATAIVLGEWFRLTWGFRFLLLISAGPVLFLSTAIQLAAGGHLFAGAIAATGMMAGLTLLFFLWPKTAAEIPLHDGVEVIRPKWLPPTLSWRHLGLLLVVLGGIELAVEAWYATGEKMRRSGVWTMAGEPEQKKSGSIWGETSWTDGDGARWSLWNSTHELSPRTKAWLEVFTPAYFYLKNTSQLPADKGIWKMKWAEGSLEGRVLYYDQKYAGDWVFYAVWPRPPSGNLETSGVRLVDDFAEHWEDALLARRAVEGRVLQIQVKGLRKQRDFRLELESVLAQRVLMR